MSKKVVRANDLGYGLTKQIRTVTPEGEMVCMHYPSLAVPSDAQSMRNLNSRHRDTVDVDVDGKLYEVGKDILKAVTGNDVGREIGENWSQSSTYKAVMLGALHYMDVDEIDVLVLGLPVNQYLSEGKCKLLQDAYAKEHKLPNGRTVKVKEVLIRPQPYGGFIDLGNNIEDLNALITAKRNFHLKENKVDIGFENLENSVDLVNKHCVLVVDPGEYTLDWLLVDHGDINTKASGAANDSGRHRIVRDVARALEQDLGRSIPPASLPAINEALRTNTKLKLGGQIHDLSKYEGVIAQSVADPISRLIEGLRGLEDKIDLILLVGGHPAMYEAELAKRFPFVPIFLPKDALYSNVRGFQLLGESWAA